MFKLNFCFKLFKENNLFMQVQDEEGLRSNCIREITLVVLKIR